MASNENSSVKTSSHPASPVSTVGVGLAVGSGTGVGIAAGVGVAVGSGTGVGIAVGVGVVVGSGGRVSKVAVGLGVTIGTIMGVDVEPTARASAGCADPSGSASHAIRRGAATIVINSAISVPRDKITIKCMRINYSLTPSGATGKSNT